MTATVRHGVLGPRSIHGGRPTLTGFTEHSARVLRATGTIPAHASQSPQALPTATLWLIDHPRSIVLNDVFEIEPDSPLDVVGFDARDVDGHTLTKVYLK